ncbi:MAG: neutral/alkaline non-lysosomal ceramidase N-terminal domain-containing protein [Deltaproteobacteria bacterium]|nr:neutral/alkaline non-lysosomal ceramidase N-terminal domain-containing protein [Deltaproteobacteria bacterium]
MRVRALLTLAALLGACSGETEEPEQRDKCGYHSDCPSGGVCYQGECFGTATCVERSNCNHVPVCGGDEFRCMCSPDNRCVPVCETDENCPTDGYCVNGACERYPGKVEGGPPSVSSTGKLEVGLGRAELTFPMGVSMAGYGSRQGPKTPYQDALGGSNAWFDKPDVRALAFADGDELWVLLRIPMGWSEDFMVTRTIEKVAKKSGIDLTGRLITSAPHSHAQPARFWHLVVGLGFGFFGYDEFNYEVLEMLTESFADAAVQALQNLRPGRFGYTVIDGFDPENRIHRDRRENNDPLPGYEGKDDRMVIMRVDDANGEPLAVLTNFGMHGTVFGFDNPILTGDAPGAVEVALTLGASRKYGHEVLGFFVQGNGGDISPAGDAHGADSLEQIQNVGYLAYQVIEPKLDEIVTRDDIDVDIVTQRVPISHSALGYAKDAFYDSDVSCEDSAKNFRFGAFQCVEGLNDRDPATKFEDGDLNCIFSIECLSGGYPVPNFQKTILAVARLGDLAIASMPGEPLSTFGRRLSDRVKEALPGVNAAFVAGYSMDHHFYLVPEEDYFQGGYEPSRGIWGWRLADYLADRSVELAAQLAKAKASRTVSSGNLKPVYWVEDHPWESEDTKVKVPPTETAGDPASVITDVPAIVERFDVTRFSWNGGHPGVDRPHIMLEKQDAGEFVQATLPGGVPYDDYPFQMLVHYDGKCTRRNCEQHAWRVDWEDGRDLPTGTYRLHAKGRAFKNGGIVDYDAHSSVFEVSPSTKLELSGVGIEGTNLVARVSEPAALALIPEPNGDLVAETVGHLMRHPQVPRWIGAPLPGDATVSVSGTIRNPGGEVSNLSGHATLSLVSEERVRLVQTSSSGARETRGAGIQPTTKASIVASALSSGPAGNYFVRLTLTDGFGNSGTATATVSKP